MARKAGYIGEEEVQRGARRVTATGTRENTWFTARAIKGSGTTFYPSLPDTVRFRVAHHDNFISPAEARQIAEMLLEAAKEADNA